MTLPSTRFGKPEDLARHRRVPAFRRRRVDQRPGLVGQRRRDAPRVTTGHTRRPSRPPPHIRTAAPRDTCSAAPGARGPPLRSVQRRPETEGLFGDELLVTMNRGASLINTARVKIVDRGRRRPRPTQRPVGWLRGRCDCARVRHVPRAPPVGMPTWRITADDTDPPGADDFTRHARHHDRVRSCPPSRACHRRARSAGTRCPSDRLRAVRGV